MIAVIRSGCREAGQDAGGCCDNDHATTDEVSHDRRQAFELAAQPVVLQRHVLALVIAAFAEAFAERGDTAGARIGRAAVDKSDHGHRRLLRARGNRPHGHAAD